MTTPLLEVRHLTKRFAVKSKSLFQKTNYLHAVEDVSFQLDHGQTIGIVGESGCGKSTLGRMIMRIIPPTSGDIVLEGTDITAMKRRQLRHIRSKFQMIFQDPYSSLNPRLRVGQIVAEPLLVNFGLERSQALHKATELLASVGIDPKDMGRYPHEFSGGQRQRIGIARALAVNPKLIVADEAVSALDVSIQSQILNLLVELRKQFDLSFLFISHNLAVVKHISDVVAVMYMGRIVEMGTKEDIYTKPAHPYTQLLLNSVLEPRPGKRERIRVRSSSEPPNPLHPPTGCPFVQRCPIAEPICSVERPPLSPIAGGHTVACHKPAIV